MKNPGMKIVLLFVILIAFLAVYYLKGGARQEPVPSPIKEEPADKHEHEKILFWTCSMHPQIRRPNPGKCPICAMDLIPVTGETQAEGAQGVPILKLSESARKIAQVQVSPAQRKFVTAEVRMVGKIDYDETRLAQISAWVPGRIDRLFVDFTGTRVQKGDHLVSLYSPELLNAQKELLESKKSTEELKNSTIESIRDSSRQMVEAAREKLRLWGLTPEQISQIEETGTPTDHLTIYSPLGGIVIRKNATEGMYVETGMEIYSIADLTHLWVRLEAYESDLALVRHGQEVEFSTEAWPGEVFKGKIAFIDPILNDMTRTVKIRVNLPNPEGKLKPNMFVRAIVHSTIAEGDKVIAPQLAGKWICSMHPEIIKDSAGTCDICDMPLVKAETLGYVGGTKEDARPPLTIPLSAPLITGKRALVYVQLPGKEGEYEPRDIVLGHRAQDSYIVLSGLNEGDLVVTNGNFKIDSEVQIQGNPSMMNPRETTPPPSYNPKSRDDLVPVRGDDNPSTSSIPAEFRNQLDGIFSSYLSMHKALVKDNLKNAKEGFKAFASALDKVDMGLLTGDLHMAWMKDLEDMRKSAGNMTKAEGIEQFRAQFASLSESLTQVARRFGFNGFEPLIRYHCPMAFNNRGADWLQRGEQIENPYFGQLMPRCGEKKEVFTPVVPASSSKIRPPLPHSH